MFKIIYIAKGPNNKIKKVPVKPNLEFPTIDAAWNYIYGELTDELGLEAPHYDDFDVDFSDEGPPPKPDDLTVFKEHRDTYGDYMSDTHRKDY